MLQLTSNITIQGAQTYSFTAIHQCTIIEDTATLTDTCELLLPKKIDWQGADNFKLPIKRGDKITVALGYDGNLKTRFTGYIRTIDAKKPIKITAEDGMFLLKTIETKKKAYPTVTLNQLLTDLLDQTGIPFSLIDKNIVLGPYRITQNTIAQELNEIKNEYGLQAYFRNINNTPTLYVGFTYPLNNRQKQNFIYGENLISEDFVYRIAQDVKVKVKAISIDDNNNRITTEIGDKDAETYTVYQYNVGLADLKLFALAQYNKFKTTGFKGSFETFGEPLITKCDIAHIEASDNNKGDFLIKKVETNFGLNGYRQKIEIGQPLNL